MTYRENGIKLLIQIGIVKTNAKIIAAACPFCNTMLSDGIKATDDNSDVQVLDVAEIIDASVSKE